MVCRERSGIEADLQYLARLPEQGVEQPWPLLVFLHGAGERASGSKKRDLKLLKRHGPWSADAFMVVAPQCRREQVWPSLAQQVVYFTKRICASFPIDRKRVYITGLSMGAFGCFAAATKAPSLYAALVGLAGGFSTELPSSAGVGTLQALAKTVPKLAEVKRMRKLPIWLFHGVHDKTIPICGSIAVVKALKEDKLREAQTKLTKLDARHSIWKKAYGRKDLYRWLLQQQNEGRAKTIAGIALEGGMFRVRFRKNKKYFEGGKFRELRDAEARTIELRRQVSKLGTCGPKKRSRRN
ncbi:zupT [Symbiodinium sp. CCMP2592]|nr:zupT [Symbiodinium sp. CCMP2592]